MRPITVTAGPLAASSANNIALSQTPTSALTLNGSTAGVLDTPRRVLITTTGNESAKTFTIIGTDWNSQVQTDIVTGPNATIGQSHLDFATVTSITISVAAANALTVGTNGVASSRWVRMDDWANAQTTVSVTVTGTVNYTVEQATQDPNSPTNPVLPYLVQWVASPDPDVVGGTANAVSFFTSTPLWARITLNSETGTTAFVSAVIMQSGSAVY